MRSSFLINASLLFFIFNISAQNSPPAFFSSENWVRDATTFKIPGRDSKASFSGIRILFEPQLGFLIQEQGNRVIVENLSTLGKFGVETNIVKNWVSLQLLFITPTKVQLDEDSPLRQSAAIPGMPATKDPEGKLNVDYGIGAGLSFLDGMLSLGYSGIFYDKRGFVNIVKNEGQYQNNFIYLNIQPISAVKALVKELKD